jgi:NADP-dependent aldehyde dehydrogenase
MSMSPVLIAGQWREANVASTFHSFNPATGEALPAEYPVSTWADCDAALSAAAEAAVVLRGVAPERIAKFLNRYADRLEARSAELVEIAHLETALPKSPRLAEGELPRTTNQLRQAARAAAEGSWALPTIDTKQNIRSYFGPLGPIAVFGPNNFPFAFNGASGGDFAAAIAAGNPVIAKAHPSHAGTSRMLAEEAFAAVGETGLPPATVQMIYRTAPEDGLKLVSDPRIGGSTFTGGRAGGLKLKAAADAAGKPVYLEMSSINPVVILPGALAERSGKIADEFTGSCLMGTGQFCTNPGLVILLAGETTDQFLGAITSRFEAAPVGPLLSAAGLKSLAFAFKTLRDAGADLVVGGNVIQGAGYRFANTLLRVSGSTFLGNSHKLQTEAFGNVSLMVLARDVAEAQAVIDRLEGNLTGSIYSSTTGEDDAIYEPVASRLRVRVGRLINDKMPTGVAISPAMNHGGPYPATGHPGFTAVGIPASMRRFAMLQCFDNVRMERLPPSLKNGNPSGSLWRLIDGKWTIEDVSAG